MTIEELKHLPLGSPVSFTYTSTKAQGFFLSIDENDGVEVATFDEEMVRANFGFEADEPYKGGRRVWPNPGTIKLLPKGEEMKKITTKSYKPKSTGKGTGPIAHRVYEPGEIVWAHLPEVMRLNAVEAIITRDHGGGKAYDIEYRADPLGPPKQTSVHSNVLFATLETAQEAIHLKEKSKFTEPVTEAITIPEPVDPSATSPFKRKEKGSKRSQKVEFQSYRAFSKFKKITNSVELFKALVNTAIEEKLPNTFPALMLSKFSIESTISEVIQLIEHTEDLNTLVPIKLEDQINAQAEAYGYTMSYALPLIYFLAEKGITTDVALRSAEAINANDTDFLFEMAPENLMTPIKRLSKMYWSARSADIFECLSIDDSFMNIYHVGDVVTDSQVATDVYNNLLQTMEDKEMSFLSKDIPKLIIKELT